MAISRGAGTEIIRTYHAKDMDDTVNNLIFGVKHHIYTVLSFILHTQTWQAAGNFFQLRLNAYDSKAGTTNQSIIITQVDMTVTQTYVWNDKFSFNGTEPTNFTGPVDDAAKQDAIADQGSDVAQKLILVTEHASDAGHVNLTYIDQNNA